MGALESELGLIGKSPNPNTTECLDLPTVLNTHTIFHLLGPVGTTCLTAYDEQLTKLDEGTDGGGGNPVEPDSGCSSEGDWKGSAHDLIGDSLQLH